MRRARPGDLEVEAREEMWSAYLIGARAGMVMEAELFVERTVFDGEGTLSALLTDHHGYITEFTIEEGESAILWYPSANRDEEVFEAPFDFRVDRNDGKQLAFGFGAHVCLGQHLARMEISALFRELLERVESIELAGEPRYMQSTFVGGLKSLPIRYRMK